MVLEEYAFTFAYWGSWAMFPFFFCPLIICWNMIKYGYSDSFPPNTFVDGLARCILFYQYGRLLYWDDMMGASIFGIVLQLIYLSVHLYYLHDKKKCYREFVKSGTFVLIVLAYANWESPALVFQRFEYIFAALNVSSLIYPVLGVKHIIQNKCTFWMPYPLVFGGQVVCTLWLLFAISVHNYLLMVQLLLSFTLGVMQIVLYFAYPKYPKIIAPELPVPRFTFQPIQPLPPMPLYFPVKKEVEDRKTRLEKARLRKQNSQRLYAVKKL